MVSKVLYVYVYLGKWPNSTNIFNIFQWDKATTHRHVWQRFMDILWEFCWYISIFVGTFCSLRWSFNNVSKWGMSIFWPRFWTPLSFWQSVQMNAAFRGSKTWLPPAGMREDMIFHCYNQNQSPLLIQNILFAARIKSPLRKSTICVLFVSPTCTGKKRDIAQVERFASDLTSRGEKLGNLM